jgi:D-hydroxyproline dehydrogenase subunit beta
MADVAIVGGGVIGCALAAFLAEAGASVRLHEREVLGAGASGRNSGVLEHPLDTALEPLYARSLEHYAALDGFDLPEEPAGCLVLGEDPAPLRSQADALTARFPAVAFDCLDEAELGRAEPGLAPGLHALRMSTGRPVPPAAAVRAFAARARAAGAELLDGSSARLAREGDRVTGVETAAGFEPAGAVVLAAGPWSGELGLPLPVSALWGVVAQVRLAAPPRHVLEEAGTESLVGTEPPATRLFSLITLDGTSSLGSSFDAAEPSPEAVAVELRTRGARFVPALADAELGPLRRCARPLSADGRPLLGPVPGVAGLHVATGHGPWGVTLGPASAELVAAALLDPMSAIAPELDVSRVL